MLNREASSLVKRRESLKAETLVFISLLPIISLLCSTFLVHAQSFQYVLGTDFYAPSDSAMPQKGVPFTDPNFHTTIVRITDKTEYRDPGIENEYSKTDPENCDGTTIILRGNAGEWYLYGTATLEMKKLFGSWFVDGIEPEPRWSATDPEILYYIYETELRTYNLDTDTSEVVHDFNSDFPSAYYITTGVEGNPSLDQRYWSFLVKDSDYNLISAVVYDKQTNSIVGHREVFPDEVEDVSMDMSGSHCIFGFDLHFFQVCSRDLSSIRDLPSGANGHNDLALTADGRDALVYQNTQTDHICMTDLDTLTETQLIEIPFTVNPDIGLHISGNCAEKPGWVLVSTYGAKQPPPDRSHSWMDTQLFMLQLQQNPTVWRIAHTHAYTSYEYTGEKNYFAESYAAINRAGSRVYFGSNWADFTAEYTDTYQVTLPSGWATIAPGSTPSATSTTPTSTPSPTSTADGQEKTSLPLEYIVLPAAAIAVAGVVAVVLLKKARASNRLQRHFT
jgi:hypothetical protein